MSATTWAQLDAQRLNDLRPRSFFSAFVRGFAITVAPLLAGYLFWRRLPDAFFVASRFVAGAYFLVVDHDVCTCGRHRCHHVVSLLEQGQPA